MIAADKYSLLNRDNSTQLIQMQLSQTQIFFQTFFLNIWNLVQISNIFKKKMTLIANAFPKLQTPKNEVRSMSIKSRLRGPFEKHDCKRAQILLKFERNRLHHI